jgi:hypothetical protein
LAVSVNIPGFGEVTAQNAAQDDTLNRIASILTDIASKQGAKVSTGSIKALNLESKKAAGSTRKAASSVENLGARSGDASSSIYGLTTAANTVKSAFAKASSSMTSGKETFGSGLIIMADMLKAGGELFSKELAKVPLGGIAGGLVGVATGVGAAILAMVAETSKSFQSLQQAGGSFGYSLDAVRNQANSAGLRLDQFQRVFAKNAKAFAAFGGSTEQGARDFARLNKAVRDGRAGFGGVGRDLLRMGIGFEEQAAGVADSLEQFKLAGMNLQSMANPAAAVGRYQLIQARQLKVLSQLNGTTIEQEKEKQKALRADATNRMILSKYTGEDRLKVEAAMAQAESLMVGGGKLFLQQMESGGPMTEGMGMMAMQYPEFAKQTGLMAQGIKGGRLSLEETSTFMARNMSEAAHAADSQRVGATAGILALGGVSNGYVDSAKKLFVHGENLGLALGNVTKIFTDLDKLSTPAKGMTKTMLDTLEAQQKISTALSTIMTDISGGKLAQDVVLGPVSGAADFLTELAETGALASAALGEKGLTGAAGDLKTMFENLIPDWMKSFVKGVSPAKPKPEALGGPINAGGSYLVGERGPELITPSQSAFVSPNNKLFALMQDSVEAAMADMRSSTKEPAMAGTNMQAEMDRISAISGQGGTATAETNDGRKRDVEDAMLALPGLLMENTDAVNKANVENTDSLNVFYRALA